MSKAKGKKPTVAQYKILEKAGITNTQDWLFKGISYQDADGNKRPSKNSDVKISYIFIHRVTGEELVLAEE